MRLDSYPNKDGMRVWLDCSDDNNELEMLIDEAKGPEQKIAFLLAGQCGLRRSEVVSVKPKDFVSGPTGKHLRIWEDYAKREHYREPPVPDRLATTVETFSYGRDENSPVVEVPAKYVYRWVRRAAERLEEKTGDEGWQYVGPHDLRRTWGTYLLEQGVLPSVVMSWGGWEDWQTFRRHYLGEFSPEAIKRERAKVNYLRGGMDADVDASNPGFNVGTMPSSHAHARRD